MWLDDFRRLEARVAKLEAHHNPNGEHLGIFVLIDSLSDRVAKLEAQLRSDTYQLYKHVRSKYEWAVTDPEKIIAASEPDIITEVFDGRSDQQNTSAEKPGVSRELSESSPASAHQSTAIRSSDRGMSEAITGEEKYLGAGPPAKAAAGQAGDAAGVMAHQSTRSHNSAPAPGERHDFSSPASPEMDHREDALIYSSFDASKHVLKDEEDRIIAWQASREGKPGMERMVLYEGDWAAPFASINECPDMPERPKYMQRGLPLYTVEAVELRIYAHALERRCEALEDSASTSQKKCSALEAELATRGSQMEYLRAQIETRPTRSAAIEAMRELWRMGYADGRQHAGELQIPAHDAVLDAAMEREKFLDALALERQKTSADLGPSVADDRGGA